MSEGVSFFNKIRNFGKLQLPTNKSALPYRINPTTYVGDGSPSFNTLLSNLQLLECYETNHIVQSVINIRAEAKANAMFIVQDLKTGEETPLKEYDKDKGILRKLISTPNYLQSSSEFLRQNSINYDVFGNSYDWAFVPVGLENNFTYKDIITINNLPSYCVEPKTSGNWLTATSKNEIISHYDFDGINGKCQSLHTNTILHTANTNLRIDYNFVKGVSKLTALNKPITNIKKAYEARNVLISKKGALGLLTSDKTDEATGTIELTDPEVKKAQEAYRKYGIMDDQYSLLIMQQPMKYQKMAMNVKDLMLFEETEQDAMAVAQAYGVPELLVKQYIKGGTFENLNASEKRLYDSTIIPEMNSRTNALNDFLKLEQEGIILKVSYDHVNVLQKNKKEEAQVKKISTEAAERAFKMGSVPYSFVMNCIGAEINDELADKYIWDLNDMQLNAIGVNNIKQNEGTNTEV